MRTASGSRAQRVAAPRHRPGAGGLQRRFGQAIQKCVILPQELRCAQGGFGKRRIFCFQQRQNVVPQPVTDAVIRSICGVFHVREAVRVQIGQNLLPRAAEDGPDEEVPLRRDAAESGQARAAQRIQQYRLQIVVCGVRGGDGLPEGGEKSVTQIPRGLFQRFAGFPCAGGSVARGGGQRHAPIVAELPDKGFVPVGFRAAQPVVEVRGGHRHAECFPQRTQDMQHCDGIRPARYGTDHRLARRKHGIFPAPAQHLIPHASTPDSRTS